MLIRKNRAGISLMELLIALAVISIGMAGVAASLYFGSVKSRHGDTLATATNYSRILIEIASGRNYLDKDISTATGLPKDDSGMNDATTQAPRLLEDPPFSAEDFLAYPYPDSEDHPNPEEPSRDIRKFTRNIRIERVGEKGTPEEFLARMIVTVYWEDKGVERSASTTAILPIVSKKP